MRLLAWPFALLVSACARPPSGSPQEGSPSIPIASGVAPTASGVTATGAGVTPTASGMTATGLGVTAPAPRVVPTAPGATPGASGVSPTLAGVTPSAAGATAAASAVDTSFLPPTPAVDLAASLRAAVTAAAAALHTPSVTHVDLDAFVLVDADHGPHFARAVDLARKALDAFFHGRFDRHPARAVTVYVFSSQDAYQRFCRGRNGGTCPTTFGQYDRVSREIVLHATAGAETLLHELVHPILGQADFPRAPAFLDEGIAALYENPVFCAKGDITGIRNWRYDDVKHALDAPEGPGSTPLESLFAMDTAAFLTLDPAHPDAGATDPAKENRHYALARYFAQWADRQGKLWPFYRAYRDGVASDPRGERAFAAVFGRTLREADPDWEAYVRGLAPPATENPCRPPK